MNDSSSRMNLSTLILIGAGLGYSPEGAQELSVEQRVHRIVEWVKTHPNAIKESNQNSNFVCNGYGTVSYQLMFREGERAFGLRYCDKSEIGKIGQEDSLEISVVDYLSEIHYQNGEVAPQRRETHFYAGGLNGFDPQKKGFWALSNPHVHRDCVTGWLGTEYVEHLQVSETSSEQNRKNRQRVQDQYLLILDEIKTFIPKATPDSYL